jgi:PhoPQ-activated pathogenicity-related protein
MSIPERHLSSVLALVLASAAPLHADLAGYLAKPDPSYAWESRGKTELGETTLYDLRLTSQSWEGIVWQHNLQVFVPKNPSPAGAALLMIDGGSQGSLDKKPAGDALLYGSMLAAKVGVPCAVLKQVPNQPLFGDLKEDALIAETFRRYLDTGDDAWPLLFPMTKAAVRAMDALGEFSAKELPARLEKFAVTGASKRGWTTWLSAASDPRVVALAPMVIDTLNSKPQMAHQIKVLGAWSDATKDYHPLLRLPENDALRKLWSEIDPYFYREKIKQPKLLILGNNDPYWATDALNFYWDGLVGPKWVHYVPNAGHDLVQKVPGTKGIPPIAALTTLGVFVRCQLNGQPFPQLEWKHDDHDGRPRVAVTSTVVPKSAKLWVAHAPTQDFRGATWKDQPATIVEKTITGEIDPPSSGSAAFYAALEYDYEGNAFTLCTQLRVVDATASGAAQ